MISYVYIASIAMALDLDEYGMGSQTPSIILDTLVNVKRPDFDANVFEYKNDDSMDNENVVDSMIPDITKPTNPVLNYYLNKRVYRGMQPQATLSQQIKNGNIPDYHPTGACMHFNLCASWADIFTPCTIVDPDHLKTHFCLACFSKGHGMMQCNIIRSQLKPCSPTNDWRTKDYTSESVVLRGPGAGNGGFAGRPKKQKGKKQRLSKKDRELLKKAKKEESDKRTKKDES